LTSIVSLDPMYVYFDVDERTLLRLRRLIREGMIKSREEAEIKIYAGLADEEGYPHVGTINFSENRVDSGTGTLRIRAVIANPKPRVLSPGLFMRVRLPVGEPHKAVLVPEQALSPDQGKKIVYVINEKNQVVYRQVDVGPLYEGMRAITRGVSEGERIVVSGLQRIRPGIVVKPNELEQPKETKAVSTEGGTPGIKPAPPASNPLPSQTNPKPVANAGRKDEKLTDAGH
jgi:RND family efflux transporter MFP subunit